MALITAVRTSFALADFEVHRVLGERLVRDLGRGFLRHLLVAGHAVLLGEIEAANRVMVTLLAPLTIFVADRTVTRLLGGCTVVSMTPEPVGRVGHGGLMTALA